MPITLTSEQLSVYRATARRREQQRSERRAARVRLAWAVAHEAAGVLRSEYGAGRVALFGSLTEGGGRFFHEHSDIDLAASGLTVATHLSALGHLLRLSPGFEFDIVDVDRCPIGLRDAIEGQGVDL
jgi:predicted nucleotidyltransferase